MPRSTVRHLEKRGIDVRHLADIGHSRASDPEIIELARDQSRAIVTLDSDFHRPLAISGASSPSAIRIRREGLRGLDLAALVHQVLEQVGDQLQRGAMVTVTERIVRLHRLPLPKVASKGDSRFQH